MTKEHIGWINYYCDLCKEKHECEVWTESKITGKTTKHIPSIICTTQNLPISEVIR